MKKILLLLMLSLWAGELRAAPRIRTILVFPFVNQSDRADLGWISEGFAEAVSRRLAGPDRFVLSRRERNAAYEDLGLVEGTPVTLASAYKVAETLGVDWAILGSFNLEGNRLMARAQLLDMRRLKLSEPLEASGELADLVELETQIAWRLLATHDPNFTAGKEEDFRRQFPEVHLDAFENYIRGILATDDASRVQFLTEADRRDPADHRAAFALGRFYFGQKDYTKSVMWLRKLAPSDDHYWESLFLLGVGEYFLGHDAAAEKAFAEVGRRLPLNEVYNNLGVVEFHQGHYAEALTDFDRAHSGDATDSQFSFNRAACFWFLKKYEQAARALRDDLQGDEDDAEAHWLLASVLEKLGDAAGSQKEKKWLADHEGSSLAAMNPGSDDSPQPRLKKNYDGRAYRLLALTLRNALEARLSKEPPAEHAAAHIERSRRFINERRYVEAERELTEAVSLAPENNEARLLLTQVYEAQGRHREAAAELETSLQLDNNASAQLWLARIYLSLDRLRQAEQHTQAALTLEPGNQDAERLIQEIRQRNSTSGSAP
jgi:tetratricopeptide (TPR) repeat protein